MLSRWAEEEWRRTKPKRGKDEKEKREGGKAERSSVHERSSDKRGESKQKVDRSRVVQDLQVVREARQIETVQGAGTLLNKHKSDEDEYEGTSSSLGKNAQSPAGRKKETGMSQHSLTQEDMAREEKLRQREERIKEREEMLRQWEMSQENSRGTQTMSDGKKRSQQKRENAVNRAGSFEGASPTNDTKHHHVSRMSGNSVSYTPGSSHQTPSSRPPSFLQEPSPRLPIQVPRCP
eukprot:758599-Hanusia_phi.AAC.3